MKAILDGHVIAECDDIVEAAGYRYFPNASVRRECLEKTQKSASDLECPHGVQFYDIVIDGMRHERAAWEYEAPLARVVQTARRTGFWKDVAFE
jgi:uncharacterized protein (DUF427 family)